MKKILAYTLLSFVLVSGAFSQTINYGKPVVEPKAILKDFNSFWVYLSDEVKMFGDFIALDTSSNVITKEGFLNLLRSGKYLPLQLRSKDESAYYKLFALTSPVNGGDIEETIRNWANEEYAYYKMEGKELPAFDFVDLEGKVYNRESTKGKVLVLKSWFIQCQACVEEMPDLNKMVKQYKNRDDILFVSLALDPREDLNTFLKKIKFSYAVIPAQRKYIFEDLKTTAFPTHFIINKQGLIHKVLKTYDDLAAVLQREVIN